MKRKLLLFFNKPVLFFLYFPLCVLFTFVILNISSKTVALAAEATLQWDPSDQATGYKLHYGLESHSYSDVLDVGPDLQYTIFDLSDNQQYFFAVTAYNEFGESDLSEEISYKPINNQAPIADAGPDQTVDELTPVVLNGSNSIDHDDGIAAFRWEQIEGTSANLVNTDEEIIAFTAPDIGSTGQALKFKLTVKDYGGITASDICIVNVSAENSPPQADAGPDQSASERELVTLDASSSFDQDDGIYSYLWTQTAGTSVKLSSVNSIKPTFVSQDVGPDGESLKFQLTVSDHGGLQTHDECIVNVSWVNEPPIADSGPDQIVQEGDTVTLDGSGSKDNDDGISSVVWSQTSGIPVNLSSPAVYQPSFTAPEVGSESISLIFNLTIIDEGRLQSQDSCIVKVDPISPITSDKVEIIEALYDAPRQKLSIKAKSDGPSKSVALSALAEYGSKEVELGQLRYDKKMKLYKQTFRKITSKPIKITVKSTGGGIDTLQ